MAEKYLNYSPYNYVVNNPIVLIDPDGRNITEFGIGNIMFDNNGHNDAISAFSLFIRQTKNVYLDIEGDEETRGKTNKLRQKSFYGQWGVFSVSSFGQGNRVLKTLRGISNFSLDNLVIETHGTQNAKGISVLKRNSLTGTAESNFIFDSELKALSDESLNLNANYRSTIEAKAAELKSLADMVTDNGRLILAACNIGKGSGGRSFGLNLNSFTGNRINIFLPTGFVNEVIGRDKANGQFIPWMNGSFKVDSAPGWLQTSPSGQQNYINYIQINRLADSPPIKIVK